MTEIYKLKRIWVLMGTVFIDMIGFLVVLPLLPYYGERYGATETMIGFLIATFSAAQLTSAPMWGRLSDRLGRRPVILGSLLLSAAAFVLFGLTDRLPDREWALVLLFVSRAVQGVGGGTTGVLQAYISDSAPPDQRTKAYGWVTAATSAGVMLGPLVGSAAFRLGGEAPGYIAAGLCLLNFTFAWRLLPESIDTAAGEEAGGGGEPAEGAEARGEAEVDGAVAPEPVAAERPDGERPSLAGAILRVLAHPASERSRLVWIYALGMMAFMAMNGVIVLYLDRVFGVGEEKIGWFYTYVGGVSLLMRALLLGPINERLGDVKTLRTGAFCLGLGLALAPLPGHVLPGNVFWLAAVIVLVPVGTALLFPATTSLVSRYSVRTETGQNLGVQQAFGGVSRMLGPIWATAVFQYVGLAAPFWIAAGLMGVVLSIALGVRGPGRDGEPRGPGGADAAPVDPA